MIPPAQRSDNGYRSCTPLHARAPRACRGLAAAVDEVQARLARERAEVLRAQRALERIQAEGAGGDDDFMTITQLAQALGVRSSTLRFREEETLVLPERVTTLRARRYGPAAIRAARVVVALRAGGYGIPAVGEVMACLDGADGLEDARRILRERILRERLDRIAARSVALLRAGADTAAVICDADAVDPTRGTPDPPV
ncbi:MerR family transcriptional regulator [Streptomyces sviceus]|uniref:MerR family transcriptional regulator n=1 Tax=Streptomyces TaxID=1883 RepID=UPI0026B596CD